MVSRKDTRSSTVAPSWQPNDSNHCSPRLGGSFCLRSTINMDAYDPDGIPRASRDRVVGLAATATTGASKLVGEWPTSDFRRALSKVDL